MKNQPVAVFHQGDLADFDEDITGADVVTDVAQGDCLIDQIAFKQFEDMGGVDLVEQRYRAFLVFDIDVNGQE